MRGILTAAVLAAGFGAPAAAQPLGLDADSAEWTRTAWASPLGEIRLRDLGAEAELSLNDAPFAKFDAWNPAILGDHEGFGLIFLPTGGNACPGSFLWLDARGPEPRLGAPFGSCSDDFAAEVTPEGRLRLVMPSMEPGVGLLAFDHDPEDLAAPAVETRLGLTASGRPPQAGAAAWIGDYPYDLLMDADWEPALRAAFGEEALQEARVSLALASPMEQEGEWLVGDGCKPRDCKSAWGVFAVSLEDGRMLLALGRGDEKPRFWGEPGDSGAPSAFERVFLSP